MGRRSTIDQLPSEIRDQVNRLIREGRTIEDIVEHLGQMGEDISRSAMGRYVKKAREKLERYKEAQDVAGIWVRQLGETPNGDVGTMIAEMLKQIAFQTLSELGEGEGERVDGREIMFLAKAIRDLEQSTKGSFERRLKIEKDALERQAAATEKTAKKLGISDEQWAQLRANFLGIDDEDA